MDQIDHLYKEKDVTFRGFRHSAGQLGGTGDKQKDKTKGGILIAQETLDKIRIATNCGYVLKMGPLCYTEKKFTSGPWCKKGDWVIFARYAGSRLPIEGGEVRLLNDDEVLGTIKDPEAVLHHI